MIAFRRCSGVRALLSAMLPFIFVEYKMPSTELIFLKRALPITKPEALPFFEDDFFGAIGRMIAQIGLTAMPQGTGAGGGTRTHTTLPSRDFKSLASTSSATSARSMSIRYRANGGKHYATGRGNQSRASCQSAMVTSATSARMPAQSRVDRVGICQGRAVAAAYAISLIRLLPGGRTSSSSKPVDRLRTT
jgi:hypothetical protein